MHTKGRTAGPKIVNKEFDRYGLNAGTTRGASLPSCYDLYVEECGRVGVGPNSAVCEQLPKMPGCYELRSLNCCSNFIGDKGLLAMLPLVQANPTLQRIRLPNNGLKNPSVLALLDVAMIHPGLVAIDLSNNRFLSLDVGAAALKLLRVRKDVVQLSLAKTTLSKKVLSDIDVAVKKNRKLADERHVNRMLNFKTIGRAELMQAKALFDALDKDRDGRVTVQEVVDKQGASSSESLFRTLDKDGDKVLTLLEYLSLAFPECNADDILYAINCFSDFTVVNYTPPVQLAAWQLAEIKELFRMYDRNADGAVSAEELRSALRDSNMGDFELPEEDMTLEQFTEVMVPYYADS